MDSGIIISLIGILGVGIPAYFIYKGQKDALKNQKEILILTLQNQKEMALLSSGQYDLLVAHQEQTKAVEGYHKEVNGKMEKLLETTAALGVERGKAEGKAEEKANPT